ncbi:MAG: antitermination protein NusG [Spirochaetaceae bacterium]|nr:antitermination protein NusG [Spirochaetaceae bacterium]
MYYALQVKTRAEERFVTLFRALHPAMDFPIYFPRRVLLERRQGKQAIQKTLPVFPGYLFSALREEDSVSDCLNALRKMDNFFRFLPSNSQVVPLGGRNLETVLHFIKHPAGLVGISKVYFNEYERIIVVEGALKGLEGQIVKVDRRKGRAKIKLDLYGEAFSIDLAFETLERK